LVYLPAVDFAVNYSEPDAAWKPPADRNTDGGANMIGGPLIGGKPPVGALIAWSPVTQKQVWRVEHPSYINGGVLATGGNLVFQGTIDGLFKAYAADSGKAVWSFDTRAPMISPAITYRAKGKQYVTVITGLGMAYPLNAAALAGPSIERFQLDPRTQARRVLTFAIGGKQMLPARPQTSAPPADPEFRPEPTRVTPGALAVGAGHAPDLRRSAIPQDRETFVQVVRGGILQPRGMPRFEELSDRQLDDIRVYLRSRAAELRGEAVATPQTSFGSMDIH
jgi:quinohemoprotein ethanol dehydrogenase